MSAAAEGDWAAQRKARGLPALAAQWRAQAETEPCDDPRCGVPAGETCVNRAGQPLIHQAAHLVRMRRAGVQLEPVTAAELDRDLRLRTPAQQDAREKANRAEADRYRREVLARQDRARRRGELSSSAAAALHHLDEIPIPPEPPEDDDEPEADVVWLRGPGGRR